MKEPLTLAQAKDEVAKELSLFTGSEEAHGSIFTDRIATIMESYHQSFIDSLRGKIEALYEETKAEKQRWKDKNIPELFATCSGQLSAYAEIITLLNETSGETGK